MIDRKKIERCSVLQHDSSDCGVACLVSVINYFGGSSTNEEIRILSGTTQSGTTLLGLYQAAEKKSIIATGFEATVQDIKDYDGILILHVLIQPEFEHYIVCYGFENQMFVIWDPSRGIEFLRSSDLERIWRSGKCLGLKASKSFRHSKLDKREKFIWLKRNIGKDSSLLTSGIILGLVISVLSLAMAVYTQKLIDKILPSKDYRLLTISLILLFALLSVRIILNAIRQTIILSQGKSFNTRIVDSFFSSILLLPKTFFDSRKTGDFIARLNDTLRIQKVIADFVGVYIIDLIIVIVSLIGLFIFNKIIALITFCSLPLFFLLVFRWNRKIISGQYDLMSSYAQVESFFIDSLKGITELKSLGWLSRAEKRNQSVYSLFQGKIYSLGLIKIKLGLLTGILGITYLILILAYSSICVIRAEMTQGVLLAIVSVGSTIIPSVLNLALISIPISEAKVALSRMFEFTSTQKEVIPDEEKCFHEKFNKIEFKTVSFRFPGRKLLFKNINLTISKGHITSLIGDSGCGKSTLVNILMRFYSPEAGLIIVNNKTKLEDISLSFWRTSIAIIPQEIHIFNGTILDNLICEQSEEMFKELKSIIAFHKLEKFFDSFPSGILTLVGEEGLNLSGGQKQIIAFVRALARKPEFLIIDEGTSNLDIDSENMIINVLSTLKDSMGILMVSHKVNLVRRISDRIYILENGTINDGGSDNMLLSGEWVAKVSFDDK
jgi:ATP-binding cassette, subfamily C, bacteriocin exporter